LRSLIVGTKQRFYFLLQRRIAVTRSINEGFALAFFYFQSGLKQCFDVLPAFRSHKRSIIPPVALFEMYDRGMKRKREPLKSLQCVVPKCESFDTRLIETFPGRERWQCNVCGQKFHGVRNPDGTFQPMGVY